MKDIGIKLQHAPSEFERVRDIEVFEGPLISEFISNGRDPFLFVWRDRDDDYNRWLAIPVRKREIAMFESRMLTLQQLIDRALCWYLVDVDARGNLARWYVTAREQLPADYIPAADSWFDPDLRPKLETERQDGQQVLIEGQWGLSEIIEYPRRYMDVYSVQYCLAPDTNSSVRENTFKWSFKSGYVYHNFFQNLAKSVPANDRASVRAIQYSSPGILEFKLNEEVGDEVLETIRRIQPRMEETKAAYDELHTWLKAKKGKRIAKKKEDNVLNDRAAISELKAFCETLGSIDYDRLRGLTETLENTAEIVLSYYRRLRTLARYELDGRAVIVSIDNPLDQELVEGFTTPTEEDMGLDPDDID